MILTMPLHSMDRWFKIADQPLRPLESQKTTRNDPCIPKTVKGAIAARNASWVTCFKFKWTGRSRMHSKGDAYECNIDVR